MQNTVKPRFCPSPTGRMHLGNFRTALFNALLAKRHGGVFLLRIEDTDKTRSQQRLAHALMDDLRWAGLVWQEGPEVGGASGPYWQSERQTIYDGHYRRLEASRSAYLCFCSDEQLAIHRKLQRVAGKPPRYPGTCRHLSAAEVGVRLARGERPVLRFWVPVDREILFDDLVRGAQRFNSNDIGDFIIRRADGTASFMYCNALDDALMGVTHAIRGEDHLTNTPRQILLLQALGLTPPCYGHIPLIVAAEGGPLSKREGSRSVDALREAGFLPQAVVNYLARLGYVYASEAVLSLDELARDFSADALGRSPARFDAEQLLRWQKAALACAETDRLWAWLSARTQARVPPGEAAVFIELVRPNVVFPADAERWAEAFYAATLDYSEVACAALRAAGRDFFEAAVSAVCEWGTEYDAVCRVIGGQKGVKGRALFAPLRLGLTGEEQGPELRRIFTLMGKERLLARLRQAQSVAGPP